ncbi:hypothetical protein B0H14DRAFT_3151102 [Mycena olivaceomarginata]|nr:hypothetical protein B0H14DRAFT_3151102 [Mycena olivaceomarginata]
MKNHRVRPSSVRAHHKFKLRSTSHHFCHVNILSLAFFPPGAARCDNGSPSLQHKLAAWRGFLVYMAAWLDNLKLWIMICGWIFLGAWDNIDSRISKMRFADPVLPFFGAPARPSVDKDTSFTLLLSLQSPAQCNSSVDSSNRTPLVTKAKCSTGAMAPPACKQLPCRDPRLGAQIAVNLADDPTLYEMLVLVATLLLRRHEGGAPDWREDEDAVRVEGLEAGLVPELVLGPSTLATFRFGCTYFPVARLRRRAQPQCQRGPAPYARSPVIWRLAQGWGHAAARTTAQGAYPNRSQSPPEPSHRQAVDIWKSSHGCMGRTFLEGTFWDDHVTFDGLPPKIIGRTFVGHHSEMAVYKTERAKRRIRK